MTVKYIYFTLSYAGAKSNLSTRESSTFLMNVKIFTIRDNLDSTYSRHDTRRKATKNEPQGLNNKGKSQATRKTKGK